MVASRAAEPPPLRCGARPGQDLRFRPWTNVRRGLLDACKRVGIERCSPNDLRRTYGRWMRIAAFPDEFIAPTMATPTHACCGSAFETLELNSFDVIYAGRETFPLAPRTQGHRSRTVLREVGLEARFAASLRGPGREPDAIHADWCPGAESNHRHGDFQSP